MKNLNIGIIGGGAAGFFAAVEIASRNSLHKITILEKSDRPLSKVKISGGGRCNITNACLDAGELVKNYPRGFKELKGVFTKFNPSDTINWFETKGVKLKIENDNRVFPLSDKSETVVNLFLSEAKKYNIEIVKNYSVNEIKKSNNGFTVNPQSKFAITFDKLLIATGGSSKSESFSFVKKLGHTIIPPVPSLFTFNVLNHPLTGLEGISLEKIKIKIEKSNLVQEDAVLITHRGLSGPAILKLSSFGARVINSRGYDFFVEINWIPEFENVKTHLREIKSDSPNQKISSHSRFKLPLRLWKKLTSLSGINDDLKWTEVSKDKLFRLEKILTNSIFHVNGKTPFKEEFVTAGGICLKEINFRTMESKICERIYFAGEVLDIDGITGGFNFQSAWSTAYIAAKSI